MSGEGRGRRREEKDEEIRRGMGYREEDDERGIKAE
jgi:hypothetical protein